MKVLIYKRTHSGDPDHLGCFGICDCMGAVRKREFEAVIGVGGIGSEAKSNGIAGQINWIGIGPHKKEVGLRGPEVTFDHFIYFDTDGPDFRKLAPVLSARMYGNNVRSVLIVSQLEQKEVDRIVQLAVHEPPSLWRKRRIKNRCKTRSSSVSCKCPSRASHRIQ
jgi:hypothetical protein